MRAGWDLVKLGSLCDIQNGFAFDSKLFNNDGKGLPLIRIRDIKRGYSETFTTEKCDNAYVVKDGDYLIGMDGEFNIGQWKSENALLNQRVCKLLPSSKILPRFIYYYIPKALKDIEAKTAYATVKHLSSKQIKEISIPNLPLPEQQHIVEILDREFAKIDALKANAEKSLQAAKDLFRKSMDILLSPQKNWTKAKLGEICSKIGSGATPSGGKRAYQNEGINLIRSLNVHNNKFRYEDLAHINDIQASLLDNVEIHKGDVLFNITGASVARCCLAPDDVIPARVNQHVSILRLIPKTIIPALLVFIMISPRQNELLMKTAENGATRQAITKRELEEWQIQYPCSTEEQKEIIARLNDLDAKCKALQDNYQKTLTLCDDLKQSLLRKAFNGEM